MLYYGRQGEEFTGPYLPRVQVEALYVDSDKAVVARHQHKLVECTDPNNNTPLSEAAAGGDPDTIR